jgi:hypothetical protein
LEVTELSKLLYETKKNEPASLTTQRLKEICQAYIKQINFGPSIKLRIGFSTASIVTLGEEINKIERGIGIQVAKYYLEEIKAEKETLDLLELAIENYNENLPRDGPALVMSELINEYASCSLPIPSEIFPKISEEIASLIENVIFSCEQIKLLKEGIEIHTKENNILVEEIPKYRQIAQSEFVLKQIEKRNNLHQEAASRYDRNFFNPRINDQQKNNYLMTERNLKQDLDAVEKPWKEAKDKYEEKIQKIVCNELDIRIKIKQIFVFQETIKNSYIYFKQILPSIPKQNDFFIKQILDDSIDLIKPVSTPTEIGMLLLREKYFKKRTNKEKIDKTQKVLLPFPSFAQGETVPEQNEEQETNKIVQKLQATVFSRKYPKEDIIIQNIFNQYQNKKLDYIKEQKECSLALIKQNQKFLEKRTKHSITLLEEIGPIERTHRLHPFVTNFDFVQFKNLKFAEYMIETSNLKEDLAFEKIKIKALNLIIQNKETNKNNKTNKQTEAATPPSLLPTEGTGEGHEQLNQNSLIKKEKTENKTNETNISENFDTQAGTQADTQENELSFFELATTAASQSEIFKNKQKEDREDQKSRDSSQLWDNITLPSAVHNQNPVYKFMFRWSSNENNHPIFGQPENFLNKFKSDLEGLTPGQKVKTLVYQIERGEKTGVIHYQGFLHLQDRIRPGTLMISLNRLGYFGIETKPKARDSSDQQCIDYCSKHETRLQGPFSYPEIYRGQDLNKILLEPYDWQKNFNEILNQNPEKRVIYWLFDPIGNTGKTEWCKTRRFFNNALVLGWGRQQDLFHVRKSFENKKEILFNLTKAMPDNVNVNDFSSALEAIKDGMFLSTKYIPEERSTFVPHVVVLSNQLPAEDSMSENRFKICRIGHETKKLYQMSKKEIDAFSKKMQQQLHNYVQQANQATSSNSNNNANYQRIFNMAAVRTYMGVRPFNYRFDKNDPIFDVFGK